MKLLLEVDFPIASYSSYEKFSSQASKYAIVGVFFSIINQKINIAITGASNKVFLIEEVKDLNINQIKSFEFDSINFNKYDINNDINASSEYRVALIKSLINKSIKNLSL